MEYPHRRYVLFLISRRMQSYEIAAECESKGLMPPNDGAFKELVGELGKFPKFWRANVTQGNVEFRRWLRDRGLLPCWAPDADMQHVHRFLLMGPMRRAFEGLMVMHGDVADARAELTLTFPDKVVPPLKVLERFCEFFWDLASMSPQGIFDFLSASADRQEFLDGYRHDMVTAYGRLGLRQRIEAEDLLDQVIQLAHQQATLLTRASVPLNGAQAAGTAALLGRGMEAVQLREEFRARRTPTDSGLRAEAADFKARLSRDRGIPSFDELMMLEEDVIDASEIEGGDEDEPRNVHPLLPVRRE